MSDIQSITPPFLRTPYNYDMESASIESGLLCEDPSLAQQQFRDDVDINNILDHWLKTGEISGGMRDPQYGDFSGLGDYHACLNTVREAQDKFMALPAKIRSRFDNDPDKLIRFVEDSNNLAEAVELGLAIQREDLSTAAPQRAQHAGGGAAVGKSGEGEKPSKKPISGVPRGFKIVPDDYGADD